ncbi:MAG: hypothetical protein U1E65_04725 [Myxococcota bacterium]
MSVEALHTPEVGEDRPWWRSPFVIGFVLGAIVLTLLPFIQRLALHAPPPLEPIPAWVLQDAAVGSVAMESLHGKVWLASFIPAPCDEDCKQSVDRFIGAARYLEDLGDKVALVTFVRPESRAVTDGIVGPAGLRWLRLSGQPAALDPTFNAFARGWDKQTRALTDRNIQFLARPTFAVVDQDGSVRGFWPADDEGRGHAINAARMFVRYGAQP